MAFFILNKSSLVLVIPLFCFLCSLILFCFCMFNSKYLFLGFLSFPLCHEFSKEASTLIYFSIPKVWPIKHGQSTAVKRKIKADLYTIQRNPTSSPHWLFQVKEKHRTPGNWSVYVTWGWKRSGYEWLTHSLHVCGLNTCCVHPLHVCGLNTCCVHSLHVCGLNTCCVPKRKHQNI